MSHTPPVLLLDKPPLRVRYLPGTGTTLVVSFSGVGKKRSLEPPIELVGSASCNGRNHVLFVTDQSRSSLNGPGIARDITSAIEATAEEVGATRIVGLGNSMGATMALHLSNMTRFDAILALTPQFSVRPEDVPEETRWRYFRSRIRTFSFPRVDRFRTEHTKYFVLHGDDESELIHALRFPRARGVSHSILPGFGHRLASSVKKRHLLEPCVQDVVNERYKRMQKRLERIGAVRRPDFERLHAAKQGVDAPFAA